MLRGVFTAIALTLAAATFGGCAAAGGGGTAGPDGVLGELRARLAAAEQASFVAEYQLEGAAPAVHARSAELDAESHVFEHGRYVVVAEAAHVCVDGRGCSSESSEAVPELPPPHAMKQLGGLGYVTARQAVDWAEAAYADPDARLESETAVIAGRHVACVTVSSDAKPDLRTCLTEQGVLADFEGFVDGEPWSVRLTSYSDKVDPELFEAAGTE